MRTQILSHVRQIPIHVSSYYYICASSYMSQYSCICVLILLYIYIYYYICVGHESIYIYIPIHAAWEHIYIFPRSTYAEVCWGMLRYADEYVYTYTHAAWMQEAARVHRKYAIYGHLRALLKASADCIKALWRLSQGTSDGASSMFATRLAYVSIRQHKSA